MKKISQKGFTLVELMVVIVIIGILAALAIPRFMGAANKTKATEFKPVLKSISTLQNAYRQEKDEFGDSAKTIGADLPGTPTATNVAKGTARFYYDVKKPTGATGVVGAATTTADGILKELNGDGITVANSQVCISEATRLVVTVAKMAPLTNLDVDATLCPAGTRTETENQ